MHKMRNLNFRFGIQKNITAKNFFKVQDKIFCDKDLNNLAYYYSGRDKIGRKKYTLRFTEK